MTAIVQELLGVGSGSNTQPTFIHLLESTAASPQVANGYLDSPIRMSSNGSPSYSAERWIRVVISGVTVIENLRFWMPGLAVPAGWRFEWGTAAASQAPVAGRKSSIAVLAPPVTDPLVANLSHVSGTSDWVVLQATAFGSFPGGVMDPASLNFTFTWDEA